MTILFLLWLFAAAFDDSGGKKYKKSRKTYYRRTKRDNSWLDAAWFHDHGQRV